jgi:cytochrome c oxidase subunit 4
VQSEVQNHEHVLPVRTYLTIFFALLILTAITVTVASFDLGPVNLIVAISIAAIKALLVALFFMHLLYDNKMYLVIFSVAVIFLAIFILFTMFDTQFRGNVNPEVANPINPRAAMYQKSAPADSSAAVTDSAK